MFAESSLIQFVFANETDDIFWDGIHRSSLYKYLFFELHNKYDVVYFMDREGDIPYVYSYGDKDAERFKKGKKFGSSPVTRMAKWLAEQLERKRYKCAFICRLDTFCNIFENEKTILRNIAMSYQNGFSKGTIILVGSHNSDKNIDYFLNSRVFDHLDENAVRSLRSDEMTDNIYLALKNSKHEACVFLNSYTKKRLIDLVTYVSLDNQHRYPGKDNIRRMSDYLTMYLNDPVFRMQEKKLFDGDVSLLYPSYKELWQQLQNEEIWNRILQRSKMYDPESSGSIIQDPFSFVYNEDSIRTKCMKLSICGAIDYYDKKTVDLLGRIFCKLNSPANRPINFEISKKIDKLLAKLSSTRHNRDKDTCYRIISAVLLCVSHMCDSDDNINKIMNTLKTLDDRISLSEGYFALKKTYDTMDYNDSYSKLLVQKIGFVQKHLHNLDNIVEVSKLNLIEDSVTDRMRSIVQEVKDNNELSSMFDFNSDS